MKIALLLNIYSNIAEQDEIICLRTISSIGNLRLGPLSGHHRSIAEYEIKGDSFSELCNKIAAIDLQSLADYITDVFGVGKVTVSVPLITKHGVLVTYNRRNVIIRNTKRYIAEDSEAQIPLFKLFIN